MSNFKERRAISKVSWIFENRKVCYKCVTIRVSLVKLILTILGGID